MPLLLAITRRLFPQFRSKGRSRGSMRTMPASVASLLLAALLLAAPPAAAQTDSSAPSPTPPLQGSMLSASASLGGPAGGYTLGLEHLFVRSQRLQIGMRAGGSYARDVVWDGTATAVNGGAFLARRVGAVGDRPLAVEAGLGATRVHEDLTSRCGEGGCSGVVSRTSFYGTLTTALRVTALEGRLTSRVGVTAFYSEGDPFVVPVLGIGVGLF